MARWTGRMRWETYLVTPDRFETSPMSSTTSAERAMRGRMDLTMAFVGTPSRFERAGFEVLGTTDAVAGAMPRLVLRRDLR